MLLNEAIPKNLFPAYINYLSCIHVNSDNFTLIIVLTSSFPVEVDDSVNRVIACFLNRTPELTTHKPFIFWLIDDALLFSQGVVPNLMNSAKEKSKGLKNQFIIALTQNKQINNLIMGFLEN